MLTMKEPPNIALDLPLAVAAHGARWSPCLLMASAAQRTVGRAKMPLHGLNAPELPR